MFLRVIAVNNSKVSEDLEHINARVLHQTLMILKPYSRSLTRKPNQNPATETRNQHHLN